MSVGLEDLEDGVDVGSGAEVQTKVVRDGRVHDGSGGSLHGVVEAGVNDVLLGGTRHATVELGRRGDRDNASNAAEPSLKRVLDRLQEVVVGLTLVLEGETSVRNVIQVLEPLEVGDGDTAGVDVHVGNDQGVVVPQDDVGSGGDRAVGSLCNDLGLDLVGVTLVNDLLHGGGHQDVALLEHDLILALDDGGGTREALDGSVLGLPVLELLGVDSLGVVDGSVPLDDADAGGASSAEVTHGVETDITKALEAETRY